jgi:hypothetical protein
MLVKIGVCKEWQNKFVSADKINEYFNYSHLIDTIIREIIRVNGNSMHLFKTKFGNSLNCLNL